MKAMCMYAASNTSCCKFPEARSETDANTRFNCNRHCDHDEDEDTSSQYEDPLECVICSAFCEC